jgi:hypothetical protein
LLSYNSQPKERNVDEYDFFLIGISVLAAALISISVVKEYWNGFALTVGLGLVLSQILISLAEIEENTRYTREEIQLQGEISRLVE